MADLPMLVSAAQHGDHNAFGQIVTRFQDMAYASAYAVVGDSMLAQDVSQEAFLEAWLNLGKLQEPAAFPGWFRRIVLGKGHRQTRTKSPPLIPLDDRTTLFHAHTTDDPFQMLAVQQELEQGLGTLNEAQRMVLALFYIEGYSYNEIATFLEVPVSTVKKRLFDGRKQLQQRMIPIMQQSLQAHKPSQDSEFASKVQFFIALRDNNLGQIKKLLAQQPTLINVTTEWKMALGHHYWPIGNMATHLSAASGQTAILAHLLDQGAPIDQPSGFGMTPLHMATLMRQQATVELLLQQGATIDAPSELGQSALHLAAMREYAELVELLLDHGADRKLQDKTGRTPSDWAMIHYHPEVGKLLGLTYRKSETETVAASSTLRTQWLGRIIDGRGNALDGGMALPIPKRNPLGNLVQTTHPVTQLVTGLKIIDLMAPLPRGGQIGVFTPLSGVGLMVLLGQMIHGFDKLYGGVTIWLVMESETLRASDQTLNWRESGVDDKMLFVAGKRSDPPAQLRQTVESALAFAEALRSENSDVLIYVDSQYAAVEGCAELLRSHSDPAITTIYHGHHTVGVVPEVFAHLDATITFDYQRAKQRLYPALDPVRSTSRLLQGETLTLQHRQVAAECKRLLQRYTDLRQPMDTFNMGVDALWYIEDDPNLANDISRARKLDRFFTQSLYGAEPWSGKIGQLLTLEETIAGCKAIVDGKMDGVTEEKFYFVGGVEDVAGD